VVKVAVLATSLETYLVAAVVVDVVRDVVLISKHKPPSVLLMPWTAQPFPFVSQRTQPVQRVPVVVLNRERAFPSVARAREQGRSVAMLVDLPSLSHAMRAKVVAGWLNPLALVVVVEEFRHKHERSTLGCPKESAMVSAFDSKAREVPVKRVHPLVICLSQSTWCRTDFSGARERTSH
jgi:hypothetical protein